MKSDISLKWSLLIISIVGLVSATIIIFFLTFNLSGQRSYAKSELTVVSQTSKNLNDGNPVESIQDIVLEKQAKSEPLLRLKIPIINVNAAVEYVGLTPAGAMDVPKSPSNVALYELGPRPGEIGSAVMAGHFGVWKNGQATVFDDLSKVRAGDKLYVEDEKGAVISFVVRESRSYNPKADASDVFNSNDGKSHLNLVTCEGIWNKTSESYPKRLVIFTDKENK